MIALKNGFPEMTAEKSCQLIRLAVRRMTKEIVVVVSRLEGRLHIERRVEIRGVAVLPLIIDDGTTIGEDARDTLPHLDVETTIIRETGMVEVIMEGVGVLVTAVIGMIGEMKEEIGIGIARMTMKTRPLATLRS